MSHSFQSARYAAARAIALEAGRHALACFEQRERLVVEYKGVQDAVSIADRDVEDLVRSRIASQFPEDRFLGEESAALAQQTSAQCASRALWIVDPIDGTSCFLHGMYAWCVSIAVVIDGEPAIGVVYDPNADELFHAETNGGAWIDANATKGEVQRRALQVADAAGARDGVLGVGISHRVSSAPFLAFIERWLASGGMFVRNGSGALMLAYTAAGRLIGYYEPHMYAWDAVAGIVLVTEAGGSTNAFLADDGLARGNAVIAANARVYGELRTGIEAADFFAARMHTCAEEACVTSG
ncbi:inositol monophosphatase [Paraburkholderia sp. J67]|uniref:inositol monophosphatase family protein n=1 Tax=Paraburkholderia sp. J67 TaxID=2805435 RepID=UPI002ABD5BCE|nr:inositol monophosphatase [Paraburkholderia sp. J67]